MLDAALGSATRIVTQPCPKAQGARRRRFKNTRAAGEILGDAWRVSWCMSRLKGETAAVRHNSSSGRSYVEGIIRCGSVWTCPTCASKITEQRRQELKAALARNEFTPVLVTYTLKHARTDPLTDLLYALNDAFRRLKMGNGWKAIVRKYKIVAYVTSLEMTWGTAAGWHPHKHCLLFLDLKPEELDASALQADLTRKYKTNLERHSIYASDVYGVNVTVGNENAGDYAGKWGMEDEITKANTKKAGEGGYNPFQLLDLYCLGEKWAGALFQEYAGVTDGKRQMVWSKGGRQVLGLGKEKEDEEITSEPEGTPEDVTLVIMNRSQWVQVVRSDNYAALLDVADYGDADQVVSFLENIGIHGVMPYDAYT